MMKMKAEADPTRVSIAWQEPAMAQIGKSGLSDNLVKEIVRLLKKHQYIKVRILRSSLGEASKKELIDELCAKTGAHLAGMRGNTAVIFRYRASQRA
jgi:RNA-binding protein YhbY